MTTNNDIINFNIIYNMKEEYDNYYEDNKNTLLDYLYEVLDSINTEIVKQNNLRYKLKYKNNIQNSYSNKKYNNKYNKNYNKNNKETFYKNNLLKRSDQDTLKNYNKNNNNLKNVNDNNDIDNEINNANSRSKLFNTNHSLKKRSIGLSNLLANQDKIKLSINRELNKLSPINIDIIYNSIVDIFVDFICDDIKINKLTDKELTSDKLKIIIITTLNEIHTKYINYQEELWFNLISKLITQVNFCNTYFKFILKLISIKNDDILNKIITKIISNKYIDIEIDISILSNDIKKKLTIGNKYNFELIMKNKDIIINEMITLLKTNNYFENDNILSSLLKLNINNNYENTFTTLGKFVKYFNDLSSKRKRNRNDMNDILLLAIYDNFKHINELLQWEPIKKDALEKRVYFTIGFLEDNKKFIQKLDTDFYRDIECELDALKRCNTIPTTIKFKLLDCIDNFIDTRNNRNT